MEKIILIAFLVLIAGMCYPQSTKRELKKELMPYTTLTGDTTLYFDAGEMDGKFRYTIKIKDNTDTVKAWMKTAIIIEDAVNDDLDYTLSPGTDSTYTVATTTSWSWDDNFAAFTRGQIVIHVSSSAVVAVRYIMKYTVPTKIKTE